MNLTSSSYLTSNDVSVRVGNTEIYLLHTARRSFEGTEQRRFDLSDEGPDYSVPEGSRRRSVNPRIRFANYEGSSNCPLRC